MGDGRLGGHHSFFMEVQMDAGQVGMKKKLGGERKKITAKNAKDAKDARTPGKRDEKEAWR